MITLISFSVLLVVGALFMTTNTVQQFFLAANVPVIATSIRRRRAIRVDRLEHLTGLCVHGYPHDPKKIPMRLPPKTVTSPPKPPPPGVPVRRSHEYDVFRQLARDQDERITRGMNYDPHTHSYRMWTKHKNPDGTFSVTYDNVSAQIVEESIKTLTGEARWDKM